MCFIITSIKLRENDEVKNAILNVMQSEQNDNHHGTGALCISKDKEVAIKRDMYMTSLEMVNDLNEFDIVSYHFRMATIGVKTIKNVHWWKIDNWAFCHNGTITGLGDESESDSFKFFKHLVEKKYLLKNNKLKGAKIKEYTNECNFWGRYIIVNLKTKNMYFFGDFDLYLLNKSYLVITSATALFENKLNVMGLVFDNDDEHEIEKMESKLEGVWMFDYAMQSFGQIFETFKEVKTQTFTPVNYSGSRPREGHEHIHLSGKQRHMGFAGREEEGNLNSDEKSVHHNQKQRRADKKANKKKERERTNESYIKEFMSRIDREIEINPYLEDEIDDEIQMGMVNQFGRTDTEDVFWKQWITPKLLLAKKPDFALRDIDAIGLLIGG